MQGTFWYTGRLIKHVIWHQQRRPAAASDADAMVGLEEQPAEGEEGEIAHTAVVDTKVHVRGVNDLTSRDVENFAADNFPTEHFLKIEWVDDTSVNLVYGTAAAAREALTALAAETPSDDPLELRRAKPLATHPHIELFVRMAVESDRKKRGAARESEFYRQNPQYKKRRYHEPDRSHARAAYEDGRASYRDAAPDPEFSADLYDDAATTTTKPARGDLFANRGGAPSRKGPRASAGRDLFADRAPLITRTRHRSASPTRDGDGRYGFDDDHTSYSRAAVRRRSPHFRRPTSSRLRDRSVSSTSSSTNYASRDALRTELFPQKKKGDASGGRGVANGAAVELFPQRSVSGGDPVREDARMQEDPRELFPDKATHRRQDAKDLHPDEVADAIGRYQIDGAVDASTTTTSGSFPTSCEGPGVVATAVAPRRIPLLLPSSPPPPPSASAAAASCRRRSRRLHHLPPPNQVVQPHTYQLPFFSHHRPPHRPSTPHETPRAVSAQQQPRLPICAYRPLHHRRRRPHHRLLDRLGSTSPRARRVV